MSTDAKGEEVWHAHDRRSPVPPSPHRDKVRPARHVAKAAEEVQKKRQCKRKRKR